MEKHTILTADVLDIIFEGRNKAYGAYQLRKSYSKRLGLALVIVLLISFSSLFVVGNTGSHQTPPPQVTDVTLAPAEPEKKEEKKKEEPKTTTASKTVKYTTPKIVEDKIVDHKDELSDMDSLLLAKIATTTRDGVTDTCVFTFPGDDEGVDTTTVAPIEDWEREFTSVQIEAQFPGGFSAWRTYLERNLRSNIPTDNGAEPGKYTVVLSFLVDRDGNISEIEILSDPGYGAAQEAVRVIKRGPKWTPAVQNGKNVTYRQKQQITFLVTELNM
jgi:protein TonB